MKLTTKTVDLIVESLKAGDYIREACEKANIGENSYYRWYRAGRRIREMQDVDTDVEITTHDEACLTFYERVEKALTEYCAKLRKEAKDHKNYDPNRELARRFGKNFDTAVEPEPEEEDEPPKLTQLEIRLKLIDELKEELEMTEEEVKNAKKRALGVYDPPAITTEEQPPFPQISDEEAEEIRIRLRERYGA